jgi:glycosyltransferase involved in cell wall biosynthesis
MLITLASIPDEFDLIVVDDKSSDATLQRLKEYQVRHIAHDKFQGVTNNWNEGYQFFLDHGYDYLFIVNNDILVPSGAIERLKRSLSPDGGNCDLVTPLSTIKGKGGWGDYESVEKVHVVTHARSQAFISNPLNYQRVQHVLDAWRRTHPEQPCEKVLTDRPGAFSGFFFGVGRGIAKAAFKPRELFITAGVPTVGQEHDLWMRMVKAGSRGCLNKCSFVYHFKGQTIPDGIDRKKWVRPDVLTVDGASVTHA